MQHSCKVCGARWHNLCLQNRLKEWETDNICGRAYCCVKEGIAAPESDSPAFFGCLQGKSQLRQSGSTTPSRTPQPPPLVLSPSPVPAKGELPLDNADPALPAPPPREYGILYLMTDFCK